MDNLQLLLSVLVVVSGLIKPFKKDLSKKWRLFFNIVFAVSLAWLTILVFNEKTPPQNNNSQITISDELAKHKFFEASGLYDASDFDEVIQTLDPVMTKRPDFFVNSKTYSYGLLILGISFDRTNPPLKNEDKAIDFLNKYLNQNSHVKFRNFARVNLAQIYKSMGRDQDQEKVLLEGATDNPDNVLFRALGNYYSDHNFRKAINFYGKAIEMKPNDYWSVLGLATVQFQKGLCSESKLNLQKAEELYKNDGAVDSSFEDALINDQKIYKAKCP